MNPRNWFRMSPKSRPVIRSRSAAKPTLRARLAVERLEDRTVPTAVAAPSGLVSWWTANNTAADVMGLNNATLTGVTYATGEVGKAFSFDGVDDWAPLGDPSSLAFTASFTIEGWIKVNGLPTNYNFGSIMFRGDGILGPGTDTLLGYGTNSGGIRTFTFNTMGLAAGTYTLFAQALDSTGALSDPTAVTVQVW